MRRTVWLVTSLLLVATLLVVGCAQPSPSPQPAPVSEVLPAKHPEGMKSLRWLTDEEKDRVIEIALNTPEALKQLEKYSRYETNLSWIAIVWENSEYSEWWGLNYDWKTGPNFSLVSGAAEFYSRVVINFGEPPQWQVLVAVNPDTGKVALIEEYPFRTGPTPPK